MNQQTEQPAALIDLKVETKGSLSITSNLDLFRDRLAEWIGSINTDPKTELEIGQADLDVKALKSAEEAIASARSQLLAQAEGLQAELDALDQVAEMPRGPRLILERRLKEYKAAILAKISKDGIDALDCATRHKGRFARSIEDALKGKRTLDSMKKAVETIVAIHNASIQKSRAEIARFARTHGEDLVPDADDLEVESLDKVEGELRRRFEQRKAREEAARLRAAKEAAEAEAAKAKAEALAAEKSIKAKNEAVKDQPEESLPWGFPPKEPRKPSVPGPDEEWTSFKAAALRCFTDLRPIRDALIHEENIIAAQLLADGINQAWKNARERRGS